MQGVHRTENRNGRRQFAWGIAALSAVVTAAACGPTSARGDDGASAPKVSGYVQFRETYMDEVGLTGSINQARVALDGSLPSSFSYRVLTELSAGGSARNAAGFSLRDAHIRWSNDPWTLTAGQFKTPFSREYLTSDTDVETADRAAGVEALATKRDIGVMGQFAIAKAATFSLGAFNGEGQNTPANRDSTMLVVGRVLVRPIAPLSMAAHVGAYGSDSTRYGFDFALEDRGALLRGEYIAQASDIREDDDRAWTVLAAYHVSPLVQFVARQEDLERSGLAPSWRNRATTGGINLFFTGGKTRLFLGAISRQVGAAAESKMRGVAQLQVKF